MPVEGTLRNRAAVAPGSQPTAGAGPPAPQHPPSTLHGRTNSGGGGSGHAVVGAGVSGHAMHNFLHHHGDDDADDDDHHRRHHHHGGIGDLSMAADGVGLAGSGLASSSHLIDPLEWRDTYRRVFANLPCAFFHTMSLLVTCFLVAIAAADRTTLHTAWYVLLEGFMVVLFTFDVASRYLLGRGSFFQNRTNVAECVLCGVCVLTFVLMLSHRASRQTDVADAGLSRSASARTEHEHELIVVVRFCAQAFRAVLYLRNALAARRDGPGGGISIAAHGLVGGGLAGSGQLVAGGLTKI